MKSQAASTSYVVVFLLLLNTLLVGYQLGKGYFSAFGYRSSQKRTYSYIGHDYPLKLPMDPLPAVEMMLQESTHYTVEGDEAFWEWYSFIETPKGFGWVRLGPDDRLFVPALFHQTHCLNNLQRALSDPQRNDPVSTPHHVHHCLNYLRSTFLCAAADNLEKGDFMARNYSELYPDISSTYDRSGPTVTCEDWSMAYDWIENNFNDWCKNRSGLESKYCANPVWS